MTDFELLLLRERMRNWRFYDSLRTDADAPARRPQVGTYTPVLASDGADLAATLQTIREIGASDELERRIEDAFPGSTLEVINAGGFFEIAMRQHGLLRPLTAAELSDGTLRYFLLVAALLSPRPPELMVLNEPEGSLHPDLLAPLARLVEQAAKRSQIIVVTHAAQLVSELAPLGWSVRGGVPLEWQHANVSAGLAAILPRMVTDIVLDEPSAERRLVIDTKFTSVLGTGRFGNASLRSHYLYQMYAYLRSQEGRDRRWDTAAGLLLHPAMGSQLHEYVKIQCHSITFATVDLCGLPTAIRNELRRILRADFWPQDDRAQPIAVFDKRGSSTAR